MNKVICSMFEQIEERRKRAGIPQGDLCQRAGVHQTTYARRKSGRGHMREETLSCLSTALDALVDERRRELNSMQEEGR
ncbi:helix-turn-helix domain-containing protein [Agrobacterium vitis]|nr:helix-turn-helix domain-containing protein [Agrobacterium vitis]MUZ80759.1 helix-turn-helix domain-containing protein [Agrobacterium vitis]MVA09106.1 helix-turn-helix domain-containing protein [Agrobacterium vitis]MVA44670.1 helix-turn-helix domain-containing protein [Agrobacterium vitis]BCH59173.1 hypothetical protein RvVAR0630_17970 [Agrobacterium vitis]